MFKGKITIVKNVNGKEEKIEKEFSSPEEYEAFLAQNNMARPLPDPKLSLSEWDALASFIDQIFEDKLSDFVALEPAQSQEQDLPVDIKKYEKEASKIEEEKAQKEAKKAEIKRAIDKLKSFVKTFEKEGKKDLAKSAKEDIKKLEAELKDLK